MGTLAKSTTWETTLASSTACENYALGWFNVIHDTGPLKVENLHHQMIVESEWVRASPCLEYRVVEFARIPGVSGTLASSTRGEKVLASFT
jgi:hypothetical protein